MNQRKQNISRWYLLGLAMILTAGCLIAATGVTYARYRTDLNWTLGFTPRELIQVTVGVLPEEGEYVDSTLQPQWTSRTEITEEGTATFYDLNFAVANNPDQTAYAKEDWQVRIRLTGTPAAWNGKGAMVLSGTLSDGTLQQVAATVTPIAQDTVQYYDFGEGWVFRFLDENGEEVTWELPGGHYSYQELTITVEDAAVEDISLLQIQVIGEPAE